MKHQIQQTARNNTYPSRPKGSVGKHRRTKNKGAFFRKYYSGIIKKPLPYNIARPLYLDLCNKMHGLLKTDLYIYVPHLGFFGLVATPTNQIANKTDWKGCYKLWAELYPQKTVEELKEIKGKPFVFHKNKLSKFSFTMSWIKTNSICKKYDHKVITKLHKDMGKLAAEPGDKVIISYSDLKVLIDKLRGHK